MKQLHPVVERYLTHLETAIRGLDSTDRREILQDIRNHIAEATAAGKPLDGVLQSLGPAAALGRAYEIELLLNPQHDRRGPAQRWFSIVGLVVVLGIPTLVAVSTLGSIGLSFVAAGLFAFISGLLDAAGVFPWMRQVTDLPPLMAILAGPVLIIVGLLSMGALRVYVRSVLRAVRAALPPVKPADGGRTPERTAV